MLFRSDASAPADLRQRALILAAAILEASGETGAGLGMQQAELILDGGQAWKKFQAICAAQGGMREPGVACHVRPICAQKGGVVREIDNRRLSRVARIAGAPRAPAAGVRFLAPLGAVIARGQPLFEIHAQTAAELDQSLEYVSAGPEIVEVD